MKGEILKALVVLSDPNPEGLAAACAEAARQGIIDGHSPARIVNLTDLKINRCAMCDPDGWGACRTKHECEIKDDFQSLHATVREAQGYVFITSVFFGAPDEAMWAFLDRLRRCEATKDQAAGEESVLLGKPTVCIAASAISSAEAVKALAEISEVMKDLKTDLFDLIPVSSRTRDYQLEKIHDSLSEMVNLPPAMSASANTRRRAEEVKRRYTARKRRRR